jgi:hypothetical protein
MHDYQQSMHDYQQQRSILYYFSVRRLFQIQNTQCVT